MGTAYNTKEELLTALLRVFKNGNKLTTSDNIRLNDEDVVETLWEKVVANTTQGTQDPNGNVTADEVGRFYVRTDTSPKEVYISLQADNSSWARINNEVTSGNGVDATNNVVSLSNLTKNTTLSGEDFNLLFDRLNTWEVKSQADPLDSNGVSSVKSTRGNAYILVEESGKVNKLLSTTSSSSMISTDGSKIGTVETNPDGQITTISSDGTNTRSTVANAGEITINTSKLKGDKYGAENTNLDWDVDDRYIPDVGAIKSNLSNFISGYEVIETVVGSPGADLYIAHEINIRDKNSKRITLALSNAPGTDAYAYTYDLDIITSTAKIGDYIIIDFVGNIGSAKCNLDGVFQNVLTQNATYIVSWDGSSLSFEMIGSPKVNFSGSDGTVSYKVGPGIYRFGSVQPFTLEKTDNVLDGESIVIFGGNVSSSDPLPDTGDTIDTSAFGTADTRKIEFIKESNKWYKVR